MTTPASIARRCAEKIVKFTRDAFEPAVVKGGFPRDKWEAALETDTKCYTALIEAAIHEANGGDKPMFRTNEEYFADKDLFCRYVHNEVNPARLKEGLSVFNDAAINRLYDIAVNGTHRTGAPVFFNCIAYDNRKSPSAAMSAERT